MIKNLIMGVDEWLNKVWCDRDVEKKYKCENCVFDSTEMEDVKKHFMENHRENYMYKCWKCDKEMKTISQLKNHYEKEHFKKNTTKLTYPKNIHMKKEIYIKMKDYNYTSDY